MCTRTDLYMAGIEYVDICALPAPVLSERLRAVDVCNHVAQDVGWDLSPGCGGLTEAAARVAIWLGEMVCNLWSAAAH